MKKCWRCAEEIQDAAIACRFCGAAQTNDGRMAQAASLMKSDRPRSGGLSCLGYAVGILIMIFAIGKCSDQWDGSPSPDNSPESLASTVTPEEAAEKLKECAAVVKSQKQVGMIRSIEIGERVLDRISITVVVNERKWNRAPYNVKMSAMAAPLCEYMRGYPTGNAMTRAVSDLSRKQLGGGAPGEGLLTVD